MPGNPLKKLMQLHRDVQVVIDGKEIDVHGDAVMNGFQKGVHFLLLIWRGFVRNRCPVRAASLAYTTLLALIPLLAVGASISTSLLKQQGDEPVNFLIEKLVIYVAPQLDLVPKNEGDTSGRDQVVKTITESIQRINTGKLGIGGMIGLVFVAIMLLSTIEATFNDIWGVTHGRAFLARIIQYWATVTLGPLIPVIAVALNAGSQFAVVENYLGKFGFIGHFLVSLIPFLVLSCAFALFYQLMPNTRVRWQAALVGGIVGGGLWQLNSLFNVLYASKVVNYNNIYGPLSLVPVFLVGLYLSWMILLFGAQVAYTFQNRSAYLQQRQADNINALGREFTSLRIMTLIAQRFIKGDPPPTEIELGQRLGVGMRLAGDVLGAMVHGKLLVEVEGRETAYTVSRPLERITVHDILHAIRVGSGHQVPSRDEAVYKRIEREYHRIQEAEQSVSGTLTLASLAEETSEK